MRPASSYFFVKHEKFLYTSRQQHISNAFSCSCSKHAQELENLHASATWLRSLEPAQWMRAARGDNAQSARWYNILLSRICLVLWHNGAVKGHWSKSFGHWQHPKAIFAAPFSTEWSLLWIKGRGRPPSYMLARKCSGRWIEKGRTTNCTSFGFSQWPG